MTMHNPSVQADPRSRRAARPISRRSLLAGSLAAAAALMTSGDAGVVWSRLAASERASRLSEGCAAFIEAFCDTFIPDTDTPGARSAGVPRFIGLLVSSYPGSAVAEFEANIALIGHDLEERGNAPFTQLSPEQREAVLAAFDEDAITRTGDEPYYGSYISLRVLTVLGYYTSQAGATKELRYELVPGRHDADIPLGPSDRAFSNGNQ